MYQQFASPAGVGFLALIKDGKSSRESVRVTEPIESTTSRNSCGNAPG